MTRKTCSPALNRAPVQRDSVPKGQYVLKDAAIFTEPDFHIVGISESIMSVNLALMFIDTEDVFFRIRKHIKPFVEKHYPQYTALLEMWIYEINEVIDNIDNRIGGIAQRQSPGDPLGISFVICSHNGAERLPQTLRHLTALRNTSGRPWEVIVVDNASTDETTQVARSLWPQDAPARLRVSLPATVFERIRRSMACPTSIDPAEVPTMATLSRRSSISRPSVIRLKRRMTTALLRRKEPPKSN